jgi:hypothetical protein
MTALVLAMLAGVFLHSESRAEPRTSPGFPCEVGPTDADDDADDHKDHAITTNGGALPVDVHGWLQGQGYIASSGREQFLPPPPQSAPAPVAPTAPQEVGQPTGPLPDMGQAPEPTSLALLLIGGAGVALAGRWAARRREENGLPRE